jgi:mono/diheme cytochrome c family protein
MQWTKPGPILVFLAAVVLGPIVLVQQVVQADPNDAAVSNTESRQAGSAESALNSTALEDHATQVIRRYCVKCHGPEEQNGDVRLDALETIDAVDRQKLFAAVQEQVHLGVMPPEEAKQPSPEDRKILLQWLDSQLTGDAAKALAEKLLRFEYGNVVDHEDLFSGEYADLPGSTEDRRWLISEYIFNEKVNRLLDYQPTRRIYGETQRVAGDSGIHWSPKTEQGNKFRRTITNPFLLPEKVGVRYSAQETVTAGHLLTMIGNAKRIAGYMASESTIRARYPAAHNLLQAEFEHRELLRSREQFLTTYTYMDRLLKDIHGDTHDNLLPEFVRQEGISYPDTPTKNGQPLGRETNLGLLGRQDGSDIQAIFRAIHAYKQGPFEIKQAEPSKADDSKPLWSPYSDADKAEYEDIMLKSEREWFIEGVPESRIRNRIATMKALFVLWDMEQIYKQASGNGNQAPTYKPLSDSEMSAIVQTIKKQRQPGDTYQRIIDKCLDDWAASFKAQREASGLNNDTLLGDVVGEYFVKVYERQPTEAERAKSVALLKSYMSKLETQPAIEKLCESLILRTEFVYRDEFGTGEADEHGRRMMSPRDASYALAYALTDSSPDEELAKAVEEGRLNTRADYEREIRRMLNRRDRWTIIDEGVQAANLNASVTNQPIRKLRFFREFFGYPKAMKVFKDDVRFGAGKHDAAVSRLIDEADLWVEHILEEDKNVFEQLLTTDEFYVFHNGDNAAMQDASEARKATHEYFKDLDWENFKAEDLALHAEFLTTKSVKELKEYHPDRAEQTLNLLKRFMKAAELHFGEGQSGAVPYMFVQYGFWNGGTVLGRTGQQMRGEEVTSYWNIDWRTWDYPTQQPAKIPNRKGILTHPAWLIAHAQNLETDPIHRGKWIREKLLAGTIPDVPITVDAVIPEDHTKTMRERMENRTGDQYCWRCHQKMDPLGFPLESYDDFGRFRTEENLEHPDNLLKEAPKQYSTEGLTYGANLPTYKTLPVNPTGVLEGTGDSALDGEVQDSFELIDRLAESDTVRQSIIRHAFRYFLGRNETLSDSKTLMDAEQAYLDSDGSFDEVVVSLLTSDSFIYRKPNSQD